MFTPGVIDPFKLLLANTSIKNKLTGYRYFRAGLQLTITVSASPFLYSALQVAYVPLDDSAGNSYAYPSDFSSSTLSVLIRSNSPTSGWVYPQDGKPLVINVPFIYPLEWYVLTSSMPSVFGSLKMVSPVSLRSAGPSSLSTCTVSVIAQFVDPQVCGLTVSAPQSGTLDGASKDLRRLGFGSAGAWASVASKALKLVGLSNPAKVEPSLPVVPKLFSDLANVDRPTYSESLSLGSATHLLSDPHNGGEDELDIATICAKPSTIGFFPWTPLGVVGDSVFRAFVTPSHVVTETATGAGGGVYEQVAFTNSAYVSTFFKRWRGTMCYRIKPIVSQFHRGKLRIFYDSGLLSTAPAEGVLSSEVIDLADVKDVVLRIPMNASTPWLSVPPWLQGGSGLTPSTFGVTTLTATYDPALYSGTIRVQIMQALTCPASLGSVTLQVDCWLEDAQFADPTHWTLTGGSALSTISPSAWQCADDDHPLVKPPIIKKPKPAEPVLPVDPPQSADNVASGLKVVTHDGSGILTSGRATSIVIGEDVISLRALMHRSSYYRPFLPRYDQVDTEVSAANLNHPINLVYIIPRFPRSFGQENRLVCEPLADHATPTIGSPVILFNFVNDTPLVRLSALFIGYKGSVRWRFASSSVDANGYPQCITVLRTNFPPGKYIVTLNESSSSVNAYNKLSFVADGLTGSAVSNLDHSGVTVDAPDYNIVKFLPSNQNLSLSSTFFVAVTQGSVGNTDCLEIRTQLKASSLGDLSCANAAIDSYVSACPDMRFFYYRGPPMCYRTLAPVNPVPFDEAAP